MIYFRIREIQIIHKEDLPCIFIIVLGLGAHIDGEQHAAPPMQHVAKQVCYLRNGSTLIAHLSWIIVRL